MTFHLEPVLNKDNEIILYDIFVDNKWMGSRRTLKQANDYIKYLENT